MILLLSERPQFERIWRLALATYGLEGTSLHPELGVEQFPNAQAIVLDGASPCFDEDELLAVTGLARSLNKVIAVQLEQSAEIHPLDDILNDVCAGLVFRSEADVMRGAGAIGRRMDPRRNERFEYIAVSPRGQEILAVFGDGQCGLRARPVATEDDGTEVNTITLSDTADVATVMFASGASTELRAGAFVRVASDVRGTPSIPIDGLALGQRIRRLRVAAGMTQAELARRTGIHRPNIARVEAGRHTPSLETLGRLADAMGIAPSKVLLDEDR